ncbi:5'-methylthioadenosine/S-adenosylhomocysteine nucleosidase [Pseudothermotoga thermarum]|uniref:MTA/SAH nucleosidase n=1 Tax=Pseudothermotoga thermarum DSM 5069 TaxID=688269 RepID=F7YYG9_9THEM|nr:5'-methylthioadenosine/S-adenosylhomocysteine nucleosidase [Pseudothermotoga thermarum]AEH50993.1 MTA/SAH nucleosidase [Pseudothermotoga thermarum DSM 5069]
MIAIVGVLHEEIEPIKNSFQYILEIGEIAKRPFFRGVINGNEIVLTYGCVGKVETAFITQALLDKFNVSGVILLGGAGSLSPEIGIGSIVCGTGYVEYDFSPRIQTDSVLEPSQKCFQKLMESLDCFYGIIASGDKFISSDLEAKKIREQSSALCVDMDSAAAAKVCWQNEKDFVAIKVIVDFAGSKAIEQYIENYHKLCTKPALSVLSFLSENLVICG